METLVCAIIAAGAAVASAIITSAASTRRVDKNLAIHDKGSENRKDALSAEHTGLSKEHAGLSKDLSLISQSITFLRDGRIADEARRESMKRQALDPQKALDVLNISLSRTAELEDELARAKEEITRLQEENTVLRQENTRLHKESAQDRGQEEEELEP